MGSRSYRESQGGRVALMTKTYTPSPQPNVALPQDVIDLVIAAREFWDDKNDLSDEAKALDRALEAFSSRVPYENEPESDR